MSTDVMQLCSRVVAFPSCLVFVCAGLIGTAQPLYAAKYSIRWLDLSTVAVGAPVGSGSGNPVGTTSVFNLPGYGNVQIGYNGAPNMTHNRGVNPAAQNRSVNPGVDSYSWASYESVDQVNFNADCSQPTAAYTVTFTFQNGPLPMGHVALGVSGLGRRDVSCNSAAQITSVSVNQTGTFLGDCVLPGGAPTQFTPGFTLINAVPDPAPGSFNTFLGVVQVNDNNVTSITLNVIQIGQDGIGFNVGKIEADSTTGVNKDFKNTTGQAADGVEITLAGVYNYIVRHFDGFTGNEFTSFSVVPAGANTILRWSGGATIPVDGIAHVGFIVPGKVFQVLGVQWLSGTTPIGCVRQVDTHTAVYGSGSPSLTVANNLVDCPPGPVYVGNFSIEYFAQAVPLDSMLIGVNRHPPHTDVIGSSPVFLGDGDMTTVGVPGAPSWATYAVVVFKVSPTTDMNDPGATTDFILTPVPGGGTTDVPPANAAGLRLSSPYPTPMSSAATLTFTLPRSEKVTLEIFSVSGRRIRTLLRGEDVPAGVRDVIWNGRNDAGALVPSGLYLLRLAALASVATQRILVVR